MERIPAEGLLDGEDGFFYGLAMAGGAEGHGTFFRMDAAGATTVLHDFTEAEGGAPFRIVRGSDGEFYGNNSIAVVKLDSAGTLTSLHGVAGNLLDSVIQGSDGNFYGTTYYGGTHAFGTVFRISADGTTWTTLHDFTAMEGAFPVGGLLEASDGKFYGSTVNGGLADGGVIYRIDASGQYEMLHSFSGSGDGLYGTSLLEASDGYLVRELGVGRVLLARRDPSGRQERRRDGSPLLRKRGRTMAKRPTGCFWKGRMGCSMERRTSEGSVEERCFASIRQQRFRF